MTRTRRLLAAPALLLLIPACGGGGGGGGSTIAPTEAPSNLAYPSPVAVLLTGTGGSGPVPTVTGTVTSWTASPALPSGLSLDASGAVVGTPTGISPEQPYTITAANAAGSTQAVLNIAVPPAPQLLLTSGSGEDVITSFALDHVSGKLLTHGWTPTVGTGPEAILAHPTRGTAYLVHSGTDTVEVLRLQPSEGDPELLQTLPLGAGQHELALHPDGDALYVTSSASDSVLSFLVAADGTLTQSGPARITGDDPGPLTVSAAGTHLYVGNRGDANIAVLPLDGSHVAQAPSGTFGLSGSIPAAMAATPTRVYLAPSNFGFVAALQADPATGALSVLNSGTTGSAPTGLSLQPGGRSLMVVQGDQNRVQRFPLGANGALGTPLAPLDLGTPISDMVHDASGLHAFVAAPDLEAIFTFKVDPATGALSSTGAVRSRGGVGHLAVSGGDAPVRKRARGLYAVDRVGGALYPYAIQSTTGALTQNGGPVPLGSDPVSVAADPYGKFLFAVCTQNRLLWSVPLDGAGNVGTPPAPVTDPPQDPVSVTVDPSGRTLFVGASFNGVVASYRINRTTGALTALSTITVGGNPSALQVDPTGQFLIVADSGSGQLKTVALNDGSLVGSPVTVSAPGGPSNVSFHVDGVSFYCAMRFSNQIQGYRLDVSNGSLLPLAPAADAGVGSEPRDVVVHPSGEYVLAALAGLSDVRRFTVQTSGIVQPANSDSAGSLPVDLELSPRGNHVYWVDPLDATVGLHLVNSTGGLTFGGAVNAGSQPTDATLAVVFD